MALEDVELKIKVIEELTGKAQEMINSLNALKQGAEKTGDGFKLGGSEAVKFATALTGISLSITGVLSFIKTAISDTMDFAEEMQRLSIQTGLTTEELQAYAKVAKSSGGDIGSFAGATRILADKVLNVKDGVKGASDAFNRWGIDIQGLIKSGATTGEILETISSRLRDVDSESRKNIMADIFGRIGTEVLPTLLKNITQVKDEMSKMNEIVSQQNIDGINALGEAWDDFWAKRQSAFSTVVGAATQLVGIYSEAATENAKKVMSMVEGGALSERQVYQASADAVGDYIGTLNSLIVTMRSAHKEQQEGTREWADTEVTLNVMTNTLTKILQGKDEETKKIATTSKVLKTQADNYIDVGKAEQLLSDISKKYKYDLEGEGKAVEELINKTQEEGDAQKVLQDRLNEINLDIEHNRIINKEKADKEIERLGEKEIEIKNRHAEIIKGIDKNVAEHGKSEAEKEAEFKNNIEKEKTRFLDAEVQKRKDFSDKQKRDKDDFKNKQKEDKKNFDKQQDNERKSQVKTNSEDEQAIIDNFWENNRLKRSKTAGLTKAEQKALNAELDKLHKEQAKNDTKTEEKLTAEQLEFKEKQEEEGKKFKGQQAFERAWAEEEEKRAWEKKKQGWKDQQDDFNNRKLKQEQEFTDKIVAMKLEADLKTNESLKTVQAELDKVNEKLAQLKDKTITVTVNVVTNSSGGYIDNDGYYHPTRGFN